MKKQNVAVNIIAKYYTQEGIKEKKKSQLQFYN